MEGQIRKVVRKGCTVSPLLFNIYVEQEISLCKEEDFRTVKIGGEIISMLRFADDIAVSRK